ncbi:MAG: TDT family transporter [Endozoicomonas sp. (ex Botrylloides leachii)]|nr:TDT family transporter [Endozoicomonas sp. (ex Botrylloides leachii)]
MASIQQMSTNNHKKPTGFIGLLEQVPTPLGGLALSIAGLGAAWAQVIPALATPLELITALTATVLILKIILKFLFHPQLIKKELTHPVIGSVMPASMMATMVISSSLLPWLGEFAKVLWLAATICHIILFMIFAYYRAREFQLEHMVPSWFIPSVGIIVATVTSQGMGHDQWAYSLFIFGLTCYFIKLPAMLYRLIFRDVLPVTALPTFAIMAAPASLSLAGYLTISKYPNPLLILILAQIAIFMTFLVYLAFLRLLRLPFSPGYAAFTFPMVIGATALIKLTIWLQTEQHLWLAELVKHLSHIELVVATVMVVYVALHYFFFYLLKPLFRKKH